MKKAKGREEENKQCEVNKEEVENRTKEGRKEGRKWGRKEGTKNRDGV